MEQQNQINTAKKVTIIIPAYNEQDTIASTIENVKQNYPDYEILVVDDGSTDNTISVIEKLGVTIVKNKINKGYGASLKIGMRKASGDIVVFMDSDGQHDCRDISRLLDAMKDSDMVVGQRSEEDLVAHRKPGKWILSLVAQLLVGHHIPDINSGFRALYRKDGLRYTPILPNGFSLTTTITLAMFKDGCDVSYIPIKISQRAGGKSTVSYVKDGIRTLLLISRVVMLFNPLKIFAPLSALLLLVGGIYTLFTLVFQSDLTETSLLLVLTGIGTLLFGLLADQISNIRRGG
ncbi:MAG: glycosyltransferase family 2 protein [Planctomycetes bacterium]|nr:glycosyltransferase family 2 protein [Planctomycetota bacterium]